MKSFVGYIFAGIGLIVLLATNQIYSLLSKVISTIKLPMIIVFGVALIILGIFILINPTKKQITISQSKEEVPIYSGEGKNRKIVAYRKD